MLLTSFAVLLLSALVLGIVLNFVFLSLVLARRLNLYLTKSEDAINTIRDLYLSALNFLKDLKSNKP